MGSEMCIRDREGRDCDEIVKSTSFAVFPIANGADPVTATASVRKAHGDLDYKTFESRVAPAQTTDRIGERIQAAVDAGIDYAINYIPGLAYDLAPMHLFEEEVIRAFN